MHPVPCAPQPIIFLAPHHSRDGLVYIHVRLVARKGKRIALAYVRAGTPVGYAVPGSKPLARLVEAAVGSRGIVCIIDKPHKPATTIKQDVTLRLAAVPFQREPG